MGTPMTMETPISSSILSHCFSERFAKNRTLRLLGDTTEAVILVDTRKSANHRILPGCLIAVLLAVHAQFAAAGVGASEMTGPKGRPWRGAKGGHFRVNHS